jgi:predicted metal-dependent hydrolase
MSQTVLDPAPAIPARVVPTRRVAFEYPADDAFPRHFVGGDLVMSHVVAVLSSLFPNGEDMFVRSVRNYRDRITDPELKKQVAGFIGQEAIHGREHREVNDRLRQLGYPTRFIDRLVYWGFFKGTVLLPKKAQLAITAALEHYTATLAEVLMTDAEARDMIIEPEVRNLFLWHALEESEHKSVAFDVYETVSGNTFRRRLVMDLVTVGFLLAVVAGTAFSLLGDRSTYNPKRLFGSLRKLRRSPWLRRDVVRHLRSYNKKGFHPDDRDTSALMERYRAELFGEGGALVSRLKGGRRGGDGPASVAAAG